MSIVILEKLKKSEQFLTKQLCNNQKKFYFTFPPNNFILNPEIIFLSKKHLIFNYKITMFGKYIESTNDKGQNN